MFQKWNIDVSKVKCACFTFETNRLHLYFTGAETLVKTDSAAGSSRVHKAWPQGPVMMNPSVTKNDEAGA
jgi:hypothetical protein